VVQQQDGTGSRQCLPSAGCLSRTTTFLQVRPHGVIIPGASLRVGHPVHPAEDLTEPRVTYRQSTCRLPPAAFVGFKAAGKHLPHPEHISRDMRVTSGRQKAHGCVVVMQIACSWEQLSLQILAQQRGGLWRSAGSFMIVCVGYGGILAGS
jgi:hypothetical protein